MRFDGSPPSHHVCIMRPAERITIRGVPKIRAQDDDDDRGIAADPPQSQMTHRRHALPASNGDANAIGYTLFANISLIYEHKMMENDVSSYASELKPRMWSVFTRLTPTNACSFDEDLFESPLVVKNPLNGRSVIRWHVRWCVLRTNFSCFYKSLAHVRPL